MRICSICNVTLHLKEDIYVVRTQNNGRSLPIEGLFVVLIRGGVLQGEMVMIRLTMSCRSAREDELAQVLVLFFLRKAQVLVLDRQRKKMKWI
jgi:hypothetical protein